MVVASKHLVLIHRITCSIYKIKFFHQVMEPSHTCFANSSVASCGQGAIPASIERVLYCPWLLKLPLFWWIFFIGLFFSLFVENCYCSMAKVLFLLALLIIASVCNCYRICLLKKDENYQSLHNMHDKLLRKFDELNSKYKILKSEFKKLTDVKQQQLKI